MDDLNRLTPRGSQATLVSDAQAVMQPLTADPATAAGQLSTDAAALVEHVGSATWPDTGTPVDPEIQQVAADCA